MFSWFFPSILLIEAKIHVPFSCHSQLRCPPPSPHTQNIRIMLSVSSFLTFSHLSRLSTFAIIQGTVFFMRSKYLNVFLVFFYFLALLHWHPFKLQGLEKQLCSFCCLSQHCYFLILFYFILKKIFVPLKFLSFCL